MPGSATLVRLADRIKNLWLGWGPYALLAALTLAAYVPVFFSDFIRLDDGFYVVHNPHVIGGFTGENLAWAFQTGYQGNWHPLTWLSHILDVRLFGLHPLGHHLTSLLFHVVNAWLLFQLLQRMTGALGRSLVVAALFALHPLHVESVAWVAERKDVLSTFFFLLALGAYARYARSSGGASETAAGSQGRPEVAAPADGRRWLAYVLALAFFALGLMSKPMLVTVPFILLLLDYWPLGRLQPGPRRTSPASLLLEKAPFFVLTIASCIVTFLVQDKSHATALALPLALRLANAIVSYAKYLGKTVWPIDLAVFYPHPDLRYPISHQWPAWIIVVATLALAMVSVGIVLRRHRAPWLVVGWFWFLGTLVPVIGLVQVGIHGLADRYTYIPLIGLFLAVVWEAEALWRAWVSSPRIPASINFEGFELKPLLTNPRIPAALASTVLLSLGLLTFRQAAFWQTNLGLFQHALVVTGGSALAHFHVGTGLGELEQFPEAKEHFQAAVRTDPTYAPPYYSLGLIAEAEGQPAQAITNYQRVIQLRPDWPPGPNQLAWLLATHPLAEVRNGAEAVRWAQRACELAGGQEPHFLATLDAAYAEAGRFDDAIRTATQGRDLALAAGDRKLAAEADARLALYARKQAFRQQP